MPNHDQNHDKEYGKRIDSTNPIKNFKDKLIIYMTGIKNKLDGGGRIVLYYYFLPQTIPTQ